MKKLIAAWLLPLLLLAGCAPQAETSVVQPDDTGSPVYTDWSKLTPYEPQSPVYTYHAGYCGADRFQPRDDYGALLPYIGRYASMEQYVIDTLPFYGLVTSSGELVSDPVYARINFFDDFFILYRGDPEGVSGGDSYSGGAFSRTLAAADGRWAHELTDSYYVSSGKGLLLTATADGSLDLWNSDGEVTTHFDSSLFTPWFGEDLDWGTEGGPFIDWTDDKVGYAVSYFANGEYLDQGVRLYLDFTDGTVTDTPPAGYSAEIDYEAISANMPDPPEVKGCQYLESVIDPVTGETYFCGYYRSGENGDGNYALFDKEGRLLTENCDLTRFETSVIVRAGLCSTIEDGCFCFRSLADNTLVFRCQMQTNTD